MRYLKIFENISQDDIIKCIEQDINIYDSAIETLPTHDESKSVRAISIDGNNVSVEIDGDYYDVDLSDVIKMDMSRIKSFEKYKGGI